MLGKMLKNVDILRRARSQREDRKLEKHISGARILKYATCMGAASAQRVKTFIHENVCVLSQSE